MPLGHVSTAIRSVATRGSTSAPTAGRAEETPLAIPDSPLYHMGMTREPLPRFCTTLSLTIELSAKDEAEADERLDKITDAVRERLGKTTFQRLAGRPEVGHIEWNDLSEV